MSVQRDLFLRDASKLVICILYFAIASVIGQAVHTVLVIVGKGGFVLLPSCSHLLGKGAGKVVTVVFDLSGIHMIRAMKLCFLRRPSGKVIPGIGLRALFGILYCAHPARGIVGVAEAVGLFFVKACPDQPAEAVGLSVVLLSISSTY